MTTYRISLKNENGYAVGNSIEIKTKKFSTAFAKAVKELKALKGDYLVIETMINGEYNYPAEYKFTGFIPN